ncbi:hypothetical protein Cni_G07427 [Canna indica]|uniref:EF-hand domain-containing protein n=1 Tax=Canna indica TaxID=4628 RepID=A0AAQ3Q4V9_9LILI|nr:hypothetical protein Cni_G07427 [Canna indica]
MMAERPEVEQFVSELCEGFRLLAEAERGVITPKSLRRNASALGMAGMTIVEAAAMVREGDIDGDRALNEKEFCVLMVRLRRREERRGRKRSFIGEKQISHALPKGAFPAPLVLRSGWPSSE